MDANAATIITLLEALLRAFEREGVEYALCGGWAVAIWGVPRLTKDIDALVREDQLDLVCEILKPVGFLFKAGWVPLPSVGVRFFRLTAIVGSQIIPLDLYPVPAGHPHLAGRRVIDWRGLRTAVLDIGDLIDMKSGSQRTKDQNDIIDLKGIRDAAR